MAALALLGFPVAGYRLPFTAPGKYAAFDDATAVDAAASADVEVVLGEASDPKVLFRADRGWEFKLGNGYPNVIYDSEDKPPFKLWYNAFVSCMWRPLVCSPVRDESALLYAESEDGWDWKKPSFKEAWLREPHHIGGGNDGGNVLRLGVYGLGVFKDPHELNKSRTFKAFGMLKQPVWDVRQEVMISRAVGGTLVSENGTHWEVEEEVALAARWDTGHSLFWDEALGRYVAMLRGPSEALETLAVSRSRPGMFTGFHEAEVVATPKSADDQMSSAQVFPYYGVYLAMLATYDAACVRKAPGTTGLSTCRDHTRCELAWSADLRSWRRFNPRALREEPESWGKLPLARQESYELIPLRPGSWRAHGCFAAKPVEVAGEADEAGEVRVYFMGVDAPHFKNRRSTFASVSLRPDGLVGVRGAGADGSGRLVTKPLKVEGNTLVVTADLRQGGSLRVSVLLPGPRRRLSAQVGEVACAETACALTAAPVLPADVLEPLAGSRVRLEIELRRATLFTFAFEARPVTSGHLAAQGAFWKFGFAALAVCGLQAWCLCRRLRKGGRAQDSLPSFPVGRPAE